MKAEHPTTDYYEVCAYTTGNWWPENQRGRLADRREYLATDEVDAVRRMRGYWKGNCDPNKAPGTVGRFCFVAKLIPGKE